MEEAVAHTSLELNNVALTFLYFCGRQLPQPHIDDILMQVQGDLSPFNDARTLALRFAHRQGFDNHAANHYEQPEQHYIGDGTDWSWEDHQWYDDSQNWHGDWYDGDEAGDEAFYEEDYDNDGYYEELPEDASQQVPPEKPPPQPMTKVSPVLEVSRHPTSTTRGSLASAAQ